MTASEMAACGWLRGMKVLTAAEVKTLPVGTKLFLIGPDRHGSKATEEGLVVQRSKEKVIRMWKRIEHVKIRDYPGKVWAVKEDA